MYIYIYQIFNTLPQNPRDKKQSLCCASMMMGVLISSHIWKEGFIDLPVVLSHRRFRDSLEEVAKAEKPYQ